METYCTRCCRHDDSTRLVYYPLSDEEIQLCADCEPNDVAVSPFELWSTAEEQRERDASVEPIDYLSFGS